MYNKQLELRIRERESVEEVEGKLIERKKKSSYRKSVS